MIMHVYTLYLKLSLQLQLLQLNMRKIDELTTSTARHVTDWLIAVVTPSAQSVHLRIRTFH